MDQIKAIGNSLRDAINRLTTWVSQNRTLALVALVGIVSIFLILYFQPVTLGEETGVGADDIAKPAAISDNNGVSVTDVPTPANLLDHYQYHVDYPNSKINDQTGNSHMSRSKQDRADDCRAQCDQTDWCHFWEHNPTQNACQLYQSISQGADYRAAIEPSQGSHVGVFERKLHA